MLVDELEKPFVLELHQILVNRSIREIKARAVAVFI